MYIVLLDEFNGYDRGAVLNVFGPLAQKLIEDGVAKKHDYGRHRSARKEQKRKEKEKAKREKRPPRDKMVRRSVDKQFNPFRVGSHVP